MDTGEHTLEHEAGRLTAILTRVFGVPDLGFIQGGVVQEALCRAFEWTAKILMASGATELAKKEER